MRLDEKCGDKKCIGRRSDLAAWTFGSLTNFVEGLASMVGKVWKTSFPEIKYPSYRDDVFKSPNLWLEGKRLDDGAEGLWRIFDDLYDFSSFIERHPGGDMWLKMTKGTDITEAFMSHHISTLPESMIESYRVRKASSRRNSPFTFNKNGFYLTLKSRIREELNNTSTSCLSDSKRIIDGLAICTVVFSMVACTIPSIFEKVIFSAFAGLLMCWTTICAHNFLHAKDNWRMYLFNFFFYSSREFRISHALSHHLYPNTLLDFEVSVYEPIFQWLPKHSKSKFTRFGPILYSFIVYLFNFDFGILMKIGSAIKARKLSYFHLEDLVPFTIPAIMYIFTGSSLTKVFIVWMLIFHFGGFFFLVIGLNAAHHHPDIFHDGDEPLKDKDWGLHQLNAVMDRHEINGSLFRVLTHFGDHGLHHLFPTLDHSLLPGLYPVFVKTCEEFGTELRITSQIDLFIGQYKQMARVECKNKSIDNEES